MRHLFYRQVKNRGKLMKGCIIYLYLDCLFEYVSVSGNCYETDLFFKS